MKQTDPKEIIIEYLDAIDSGNEKKLEFLLDENHKMLSPVKNHAVGKSECLALMKDFHDAFSRPKRIVRNIICEGEWVACKCIFSGVHTGDFCGIPASGRTINMAFIEMTRVVNGKIKEDILQYDAMDMMAQMGISPFDDHC